MREPWQSFLSCLFGTQNALPYVNNAIRTNTEEPCHVLGRPQVATSPHPDEVGVADTCPLFTKPVSLCSRPTARPSAACLTLGGMRVEITCPAS